MVRCGMSWKIAEKYRRILAGEEGSVVKGWGGKLTVCLVYPNHYRTGMSNLGFQAVYALLNDCQDVVCERAFLPEPTDLAEYAASNTRLLSLETQRPLADFDLIAFSVSFETDYLHIPQLLALANIPPLASERSSAFPLVIAGGAALFLNPEPVAEFIDLICLGEGEVLIPKLLDLLRTSSDGERSAFLRTAATCPGMYVPSFYTVSYDGDAVTAIRPAEGLSPCVQRQWAAELDTAQTGSQLFTPETEFGDMYLVELSRGCPRGCRFCAAGFIYEPYRQRSLESVREQVRKALERHQRIGLVGAAVGDFRKIGQLCRFIRDEGGKVSVASLRIDALDDEMIRVLVESGHKTVSLAPEGASQRLRTMIRKGITREQILDAAERLISHDILNLKLYFIVGFPGETMADLEEMVQLVEDIRSQMAATARGNRRLGQLTLSVNPFVPKPFTPFQWCGMERAAILEKKAAFLRKTCGRLPNVRVQFEGIKEAVFQALLSRGDRRLASLLLKAGETGSWRRAARDLGVDLERQVCRTIPLDEVLPWDIICCDKRERLLHEYRLALDGTPPEGVES